MFGERLRMLRRRYRISQEDFAEVVGVARQTIMKWENNERVPDVLMAKKMAEALQVTLDEMLDFDEEKGEEQLPSLEADEKYVFGKITVGPGGQIRIPKEARKVLDIKTGDEMIVLGDIERGIELISADILWEGRFSRSRSEEEKTEGDISNTNKY